MRLAIYGVASTVLATGVVISAFNQRANFYSACVYLSQSTACLLVLTNLLILISIALGHGLQRFFYGPLRAIEIEQIYEKAWYAVTETCLAMTIFRDEFDVRFIVMFGILLFVKCFSWIGQGRVEFMEQQPPDRPWLFHSRLASSLLLLVGSCAWMVWHSVSSVLERGRPNMMVMFAFEFAILLITSIGILDRYILGLVEKVVLNRELKRVKEARTRDREEARRRREQERDERERSRTAEDHDSVDGDEDDEEEDEEIDVGAWEEKGTWLFYCEIATDLLKLLTYISFFSIVLTWYGLPLHIIRDVYITIRSFITRIRDFIRYRRATAHMNTRYPDASADDINRDHLCIICREEMRQWTEEAGRTPSAHEQRQRPKKLPCGHVLHFACLRSWLERQQRCPTCRRPVLEEGAQPPANGNAPANGRPQQNGNGMGFQAQFGIGPLGVDIGFGGPAFVQNFAERLNQQNQQRQQGQAQGQDQQAQPQTPAQAAQPQAPPNLNQPALGLPPVPGTQQQNGTATPGSAAAEIQHHIQRTRQLIEREQAMLQVSQRQLEQLQILQAQAAGQPPQSQSASSPFTTPGLPQGVTLPPGWSIVPLTIAQTAPATPAIPISTPSAQSPFSSTSARPSPSIPLHLRRSQRDYQESMRSYHNSLTPSTETTQADIEARMRESELSLTPDQLERLPIPVQEAVIVIASYLRQQPSHDSINILATLPIGLRTEILEALPNRTEFDSRIGTTSSNPQLALMRLSHVLARLSSDRKALVLEGLAEGGFSEAMKKALEKREEAIRWREWADRLEDGEDVGPRPPKPRNLEVFGGEGSVFPVDAQERARRQMEKEGEERERQWTERVPVGVVEGLLGGREKKEEEDGWEDVVPTPTVGSVEDRDKGKGKGKGKGKEVVRDEDPGLGEGMD